MILDQRYLGAAAKFARSRSKFYQAFNNASRILMKEPVDLRISIRFMCDHRYNALNEPLKSLRTLYVTLGVDAYKHPNLSETHSSCSIHYRHASRLLQWSSCPRPITVLRNICFEVFRSPSDLGHISCLDGNINPSHDSGTLLHLIVPHL